MNNSLFSKDNVNLSDSIHNTAAAPDDSLIHVNILEQPKETTVTTDSLSRGTQSVFSDKTIVVDDSLMRELDEDPNDTISVIIKTPDTLDVSMYPQGESGFSPKIYVTKENGIATITIMDKTGTHTTEIKDGSASELDVQFEGQSIVKNQVANFVSGTNIKTINGEPILGPGNITVAAEPYDDTKLREEINEKANIIMKEWVGDNVE